MSPTPEPGPVQSLSDARERVIEELSVHFANDRISLEDLESRIERVYKAASMAELHGITADLPRGAAVPAVPELPLPVPAPMVRERERVLFLMSNTRRRGAWAVPQRLDVVALMSDATIDLTQALLPAGIVDLHVRAMWAAVKIIVPPGLQVVSRLDAVMANLSGGSEPEYDRAGASTWRTTTVVRLSGWALMAEVQIRVRRRELLAGDDNA